MIKISNPHTEKHLHDFTTTTTIYEDTIEGDYLIPETEADKREVENRRRYAPHVLCAECAAQNEPNYATDNVITEGRSIPVCDGCAAEIARQQAN